MTKRAALAVAAGAAVVWGCAAHAQPSPFSPVEPAPQTPPPPKPFEDPTAPKPWTIEIEPLVWFVGPSGKVKLPVSSGTGPGGFTTEGDEVKLSSLDLQETRLRPAGVAHISADAWRFTFSGTDYSTSRPDTVAADTFRIGAVALAPGDRFDSKFSLGTYELTAGRQIGEWEKDFQKCSTCPEDAIPVLLKLYIIAGARMYDSEFDVRRTTGVPAEARSNEFFIEPMLGARLEIEITKTFALDLQLSGGGWPVGNHSTYSFDIAVGFQYRPIDNLAWQIGYRNLIMNLRDGEGLSKFEYDGTLAGLYTGIVIRF